MHVILKASAAEFWKASVLESNFSIGEQTHAVLVRQACRSLVVRVPQSLGLLFPS